MNAEEEKNDTIVIDLKDLFFLNPNTKPRWHSHDSAFRSIHERKGNILLQSIGMNVSQNKHNGSNQDSNFANLNYFISGERGSGKSTFLSYILEELCKKASDKREKLGLESLKFGELLYCDPTATETGEHFMMFVITKIYHLLQRYRKYDEEDEMVRDGKWERHSSNYEECQKLLKKMSKGLSLLQKQGRVLEDMDEEVLLHESIARSESCYQLKNHFDELINKLAKLMKVDALVISIDDADTHFERGYEVLETIRKYLCHPKLVLLVTGDMQLYSQVLLHMQFSKFGKDFHHFDERGKEERVNLLHNLSSQYLLKLFPSSHRIQLFSLYTMMYESYQPTIFEVDFDGKKMNSKLLMTRAFQLSITNSPFEAAPYVRLFFSLPLRSIIQTWIFWKERNLMEKLDSLFPGDETEPDLEQHAQIRTSREAICESFKKVMMNELISLGYKIDALFTLDNASLCEALLRHCRQINDVEYGFALKCDCIQLRDRLNSLYLAMEVRSRVVDLKSFFEYWLFGPGTVSLYAKACEHCRIDAPDNLPQLPGDFDSYMQVGGLYSPTRWARHANMIFCHDSTHEGAHNGIIRIRNIAYQVDFSRYMHILANSIEDNNKGTKDEHSLRSLYMLLACMTKSEGNDGSWFFSIFNLLAVMMGCLDIYQEYRSAELVNEDRIVDKINKYICSLRHVKSCRRPDFFLKEDKKVFSEEDKKGKEKTLSPGELSRSIWSRTKWPDPGSLAEEIVQWCKEVYSGGYDMKRDYLSAQEIAYSWNAFYYKLSDACHIFTKSNSVETRLKEVYEKVFPFEEKLYDGFKKFYTMKDKNSRDDMFKYIKDFSNKYDHLNNINHYYYLHNNLKNNRQWWTQYLVELIHTGMIYSEDGKTHGGLLGGIMGQTLIDYTKQVMDMLHSDHPVIGEYFKKIKKFPLWVK